MIAGVKFRAIPAERGTWRLTGDGVRKAIETAKADGYIPFFLTATFGTTPTCAVDDLEGIAQVGRDCPEIWLHVDAAVCYFVSIDNGSMLVLPSFVRSTIISSRRWGITIRST